MAPMARWRTGASKRVAVAHGNISNGAGVKRRKLRLWQARQLAASHGMAAGAALRHLRLRASIKRMLGISALKSAWQSGVMAGNITSAVSLAWRPDVSGALQPSQIAAMRTYVHAACTRVRGACENHRCGSMRQRCLSAPLFRLSEKPRWRSAGWRQAAGMSYSHGSGGSTQRTPRHTSLSAITLAIKR